VATCIRGRLMLHYRERLISGDFEVKP